MISLFKIEDKHLTRAVSDGAEHLSFFFTPSRLYIVNSLIRFSATSFLKLLDFCFSDSSSPIFLVSICLISLVFVYSPLVLFRLKMSSIDSDRTLSDTQGATMSSASQSVAGTAPLDDVARDVVASDQDVVDDSGLRLYVDFEKVRKEYKIPKQVIIEGYPVDFDYYSRQGVGDGKALFVVSQLKAFRFPLLFPF